MYRTHLTQLRSHPPLYIAPCFALRVLHLPGAAWHTAPYGSL